MSTSMLNHHPTDSCSSAQSYDLHEENNDINSLSRLTDMASFSSVAHKLHEALKQITTPENSVMATLSDNVHKLQDGFVDALYSIFTTENIDLNCKITLGMGKNGLLIFLGSHPQKEIIEAIFHNNLALSSAFLEIASQSVALRDIRSLHTMVTHIAGIDHYTRLQKPPADISYQVSIKEEMNHFYFSNPHYLA